LYIAGSYNPLPDFLRWFMLSQIHQVFIRNPVNQHFHVYPVYKWSCYFLVVAGNLCPGTAALNLIIKEITALAWVSRSNKHKISRKCNSTRRTGYSNLPVLKRL